MDIYELNMEVRGFDNIELSKVYCDLESTLQSNRWENLTEDDIQYNGHLVGVGMFYKELLIEIALEFNTGSNYYNTIYPRHNITTPWMISVSLTPRASGNRIPITDYKSLNKILKEQYPALYVEDFFNLILLPINSEDFFNSLIETIDLLHKNLSTIYNDFIEKHESGFERITKRGDR